MIKRDWIKRDSLEETEIVCDCCHKSVSIPENLSNPSEDENFLRIWHKYGYNSEIFGDMTVIRCELCEKCTKKILGEYLQIEEDKHV